MVAADHTRVGDTMYTIWFRFYGVHSIDVEGIVEACMAWDALSSQFSMMSSRPCDGVACTHECCVSIGDDMIVTDTNGVVTVIKPECDETW